MNILKPLVKLKQKIVGWVTAYISCCRHELKYVRWYWRPLWILGQVITIIDEIGRIEIWRWPRKFKDWDHFELHLEKILEVLRQNNQSDWVYYINDAKTISQSSLEILFALTDELKRLYYSPISKQLGLRGDVKKAISYLNSFRR